MITEKNPLHLGDGMKNLGGWLGRKINGGQCSLANGIFISRTLLAIRQSHCLVSK